MFLYHKRKIIKKKRSKRLMYKILCFFGKFMIIATLIKIYINVNSYVTLTD